MNTIIPASVTGIGDYAFGNCSSLRSVTIPASVTSIGIGAFRYCSELSTVTIPEGVTSIGFCAFSGCSSLSAIKVETGNTVYDSRENCNAIIETTSNTLISGCKNTIIPASVTGIGDYAFWECSNLSSVTIPASVTSIGIGAFRYCSELSTVAIPKGVTSIGFCAFSGCSSLSAIKVETGNTVYDSRENCNAIIETTSNTLISGCKNTIIPASVTGIGDCAFEYCSSLRSVTIPASVTSIGSGAFRECSELSTVTIPEGVTSIGDSAFSYCSSLSSMTIPATVTSIGLWVFSGCSSLSSIKVETGNTVYDSRENCNAIIETTSNTLRFGCKNTIIPASVTSIGYDAFGGCGSLSSVTIPESVTSIGDSAFEDCSSLSSVTIPASVTGIGNSAFENCSSLSSVTIPASVTDIGIGAFSDCSSDLVIRGMKGSEAQRYALENNISFKVIEEESETPSELEKPTESQKPSDSQSQNTPPVSQTPAVTASDQKISAKNFSKTASTKTQSFKLGATASTALTYASDNKNIKVDANGKVTIAKNYAGKATITIHAAATSAYNGATAKVTVTVKPVKLTASKITAKAKKKAVTVKFSKAAGAKSYKVEVATDKKFKKNVKSVTVKKTTATIKSLKAGKKYYVRVTAIGNSSVKSSAVVAKKTVKIK